MTNSLAFQVTLLLPAMLYQGSDGSSVFSSFKFLMSPSLEAVSYAHENHWWHLAVAAAQWAEPEQPSETHSGLDEGAGLSDPRL